MGPASSNLSCGRRQKSRSLGRGSRIICGIRVRSSISKYACVPLRLRQEPDEARQWQAMKVARKLIMGLRRPWRGWGEFVAAIDAAGYKTLRTSGSVMSLARRKPKSCAWRTELSKHCSMHSDACPCSWEQERCQRTVAHPSLLPSFFATLRTFSLPPPWVASRISNSWPSIGAGTISPRIARGRRGRRRGRRRS